MAKTQEEQGLVGRKGLTAELSGMNKRIEERRGNPRVSEFRVSLHCSEQLWDEGNDGTGWAGVGVSAIRSIARVSLNTLQT